MISLDNIFNDQSVGPYLKRQGITPEQYGRLINWSEYAEKGYGVDIVTSEDLENPVLRQLVESISHQGNGLVDLEIEWPCFLEVLQSLLELGASIMITTVQNFEHQYEAAVNIRFDRYEVWQCKTYLAENSVEKSILTSIINDLSEFAVAIDTYRHMTEIALDYETLGLEILSHKAPRLRDPHGSIDVICVLDPSTDIRRYSCDPSNLDDLKLFCESLSLHKALTKINNEILCEYFDRHYLLRIHDGSFSLEIRDNDFQNTHASEHAAYDKFGNSICHSHSKTGNSIYHSHVKDNYQKLTSYLADIADRFYPSDAPKIKESISGITEQCKPSSPTTPIT